MRDHFTFLRQSRGSTPNLRVSPVSGLENPQNSAVSGSAPAETRAENANVSCVSAPSRPGSKCLLMEPRYVPPGPAGDELADWAAFYEERAAIRQYDAGYDRETAERLAFGECIEAWCERHRVRHDPARCAGCGGPLVDDALHLADGARVCFGEGQDFTCLLRHGHRRKRRAVDALFALGLTAPTEWSLK